MAWKLFPISRSSRNKKCSGHKLFNPVTEFLVSLRRPDLNASAILETLKELTLDLAAGKNNQADTVTELHRRIEANLVYDMDEKEPQREFITQVFVSLDNLLDPGFPPSPAEMNYFAECFEGRREFKLEEVRQFELVSMEAIETEKGERKPKTRNFNKARIARGKTGLHKSQTNPNPKNPR
jgi:hypothetical protein